jgi:hypothetical protein
MKVFSEHAVLRVRQRTKMTTCEILELISAGRALNMGCKPGIPKRHILFYSAADDSCFVAIQDELDGTIITVLPVDYHLNLAWDVTPELEQMARAMYENGPAPDHVKKDSAPSKFYVSCRYYDDQLAIKTKRLFSVPLGQYGSNAELLIKGKYFKAMVVEHSITKGIMPSLIEDIFVRIGSDPYSTPELFVKFDELH